MVRLVLRVCDFGLSNTMSVISAQTGSSQPGTLIFAAPEVLDGGSLSASSDVYSFGMLAWHLFSRGKAIEPFRVRGVPYSSRLRQGLRNMCMLL